jgi:hypothetical protein
MSICKHEVDSEKGICANCQNARHRKASIKTRKCIAWLTKLLAPMFGHFIQDGCICCGIHSAVTPMHTVWHNEGSGSAVLCEGCWHDLAIPEKLKFYKMAYERWWSGEGWEKWEEIEKSIIHPYYWRNESGAYLSFKEVL